MRMLRMGVDTHLITAHHALPLMLKTASDETPGLVVEMTDGTFEFNANFRERVGFYYDLVKANVQRIVVGLTFELREHPEIRGLGRDAWLASLGEDARQLRRHRRDVARRAGGATRVRD